MKNFAVKIFALYLFFSVLTLSGSTVIAQESNIEQEFSIEQESSRPSTCNNFASAYYYSMARKWWFSPIMYATFMALGAAYACNQ